MKAFLKRLRYGTLIPIALLLSLTPFRPEPHLLEKLRMLSQGALSRPIDIFDLLMHGAPALILIAKVVVELSDRNRKVSGE